MLNNPQANYYFLRLSVIDSGCGWAGMDPSNPRMKLIAKLSLSDESGKTIYAHRKLFYER